MLPLFDMMMKAGGGQGGGASMEAFARQFNLAQEQVSEAMAALMPAFSAGFNAAGLGCLAGGVDGAAALSAGRAGCSDLAEGAAAGALPPG